MLIFNTHKTSETAALLDITKKKETLQSSIESHDSQLSDNQKNLKVSFFLISSIIIPPN